MRVATRQTGGCFQKPVSRGAPSATCTWPAPRHRLISSTCRRRLTPEWPLSANIAPTSTGSGGSSTPTTSCVASRGLLVWRRDVSTPLRFSDLWLAESRSGLQPFIGPADRWHIQKTRGRNTFYFQSRPSTPYRSYPSSAGRPPLPQIAGTGLARVRPPIESQFSRGDLGDEAVQRAEGQHPLRTLARRGIPWKERGQTGGQRCQATTIELAQRVQAD